MTSLERVEAVVRAVLYEGYMLYPYRPSSVKNRQRWTFGGIHPRACAAEDESLHATVQTECLVEGGPEAVVEVRVRFLHLLNREVGRLDEPVAALPAGREPPITAVASLDVGDQRFHAWEEVVERTVAIPETTIGQLKSGARTLPFAFASERALEPLRDTDGHVRGVLIRTSAAVAGEITMAASTVAAFVSRLTVRIVNVTPVERPATLDRAELTRLSFASTHTILTIRGGAFVSLLDPPEGLAEAAGACENQGTWPAMAGEEGARDMVLSSPIILYDYPQVAPESPGDLFDATEIDEILSLRILAMTDDEKRDIAAADELDGEAAVIEAIERDFEDKVHVAVVLENDPGRELGLARMPGHRFFFTPDELEALPAEPRP